MSTIIRTIRIPLDAVYAQNADIGLFTSEGVSELRYTESPLSGVATQYKEGLIIDIGTISHRADFRNGGAQVQVSDVEIILGNAANNEQFNYVLKFAGINLIGLVGEIEEYVGTEADSDATEVVNTFTGSFEIINWNELEYKITAKSSLALRRNNYLCRKSGDVVIPATFGESDPDRGIYFKAVRTTSNVKTLNLTDMKQGGTALPEKMNLFPVYQRTGASPSIVYQFRLGYMDSSALPDGEYFVGKYVLVKEGEADLVGVYRRITGATVIGTGQAIIELTFSDYFPKDLTGTWDADGENQTWVQFVDIEREYTVDVAACSGFFNSNNEQLSNNAELYSKKDDEVIRIPEYGYEVNEDVSDNNSLVINPIMFNSSPDDILSFVMLPVQSFGLYTEANLSKFGVTIEDKYGDGVYATSGDQQNVNITSDIVLSRLFDKNMATYCELLSTFYWFDGSGPAIAYLYHAFSFKLPEISDKIQFQKVYMALKLVENGPYDSSNNLHTCRVEVRKRGYINRLHDVYIGDAMSAYPSAQNGDPTTFDNLTDYYSGQDTNNKNFFFAGNVNGVLSGYKRIDMNISNKDQYGAIEECLLTIRRGLEYDTDIIFRERTRIYAFFLMFELSSNIKDEIYV